MKAVRTVKVDGCQLINHIFRGGALLEDASLFWHVSPQSEYTARDCVQGEPIKIDRVTFFCFCRLTASGGLRQ